MDCKILIILGVIIFSFAMSDSTVFGASAPSKPLDLVADDISPTKIVLSWTTPNDGGSPITGYRIEVKKIPENYYVLVSNTQNTNTTYVHSGLETGKTYIYRVYAINAIGQSDPSSEAVATPSSSSAPPENIVPNIPTGLDAQDVSPTQVDLSWIKPSSNNGPPITGYKIEIKSGSGSFKTLVNNTSNTVTTYSHKNATTGTSYSYRVYAINSVGLSNPSNTATATPTQNSSPPVQNIVPNSPTNFQVATISPSELALSWKAPQSNNGPPVTGYKIEVKKNGEDYSILVANNGPKMSYRHTNLVEGTTYTYRVSAINSVGFGTPSEASGKPQHTLVPTYLEAKASSPTQIDLSWIAPSQTYGMPIRSYVIQEKIATDTYQTVGETSGTETEFSVTKLTTDKTYTFVVFAKYSLGASNISNEATATPTSTSSKEPAQTVPSPPTGLAVFAKSISQNDLFWNEPSNNGGADIIGYKIEVKSGTGRYSTLVHNTGSTSRTFSHSNLLPNTTYTYRVSAINEIGVSGTSNEASATTAAPKTITVPTAPTDLTAKLISSGQINLSWGVPTNNGGAEIIGYKIEVKQDGGEFKLLSANTGKITSYSQTGIIDGKTYSYRVYAINSAGTSITSAVATVIVPAKQIKEEKPTVKEETSEEPEKESQLEKDTTKRIPGFPDPSKDPQYYLDRYNNEPAYKAWFDKNFPDDTIYDVLKIEPPPQPKGICGEGTTYVNGECVKTQEPITEPQKPEEVNYMPNLGIAIAVVAGAVVFLIWKKKSSGYHY